VSRVWPLCAVLALGCSSPPQKQDETQVTYNASFTSSQGDANVVFPSPNDNSAATVQAGLAIADGGTFSTFDDGHGTGFALESFVGAASMTYTNAHLTGLGSGAALPQVALFRQDPDGGPNDYFFVVNKAGEPIVQVQFEYTAQRDCGSHCGGKRSWTYSGQVGTGLQVVTLSYTEEQQP
jgi:hypothetical protein